MSEASFGYLQLIGVQSGSSDPRYPGFIRINTFGLVNSSRMGGSGFNNNPLNRVIMTTPVDFSTPKLCQLSATGKVLKKAALVWLRGRSVTWSVTLENVTVGETRFSPNAGSDLELTLDFLHMDGGQMASQAAASKLRFLGFQSRH